VCQWHHPQWQLAHLKIDADFFFKSELKCFSKLALLLFNYNICTFKMHFNFKLLDCQPIHKQPLTDDRLCCSDEKQMRADHTKKLNDLTEVKK